jgi:uncharacterized protein (DUF433 family)
MIRRLQMNSKWLKFGLGAVAIALAVVVGVGVVLPANAQGPMWGGWDRGFPPMGGWFGGMFAGQGSSPLGPIAQALGMNEADLLKELQAGKSVADVAKEKGVELDKVVDAILAKIKENLPQMFETKWGAGGMGFGGPRGFGRGMFGGKNFGLGFQRDSLLTSVATTLGMTEADLLKELQAGKSVADVAKEKGVALDKVVDAILAERAETLKQAVSSGYITQQQADSILANVKENLPQMLETKWGAGGMGFGGRHGLGRGMPGGGRGMGFGGPHGYGRDKHGGGRGMGFGFGPRGPVGPGRTL